MTLDQLQHLSQAGVKIEISAADLLQVFKSIAAEQKTRQTAEKRLISLSQAVAEYGRTEKTLLRYVAEGVLMGEKQGGRWLIESPQARGERIQQRNNIYNN